MQQLFTLFQLLPGYLVFLAIFLIIIPTIFGIICRISLYNHLSEVSQAIKYLLHRGELERLPHIIYRIEPRFEISASGAEKLNTAAIIEGTYSQEKVKILGLSVFCDVIDYFTRILPNLLLSFGLLGTFLGITINLASLSQTITQVDITDVRSLIEELDQPLQGMGVAFITSLIAIASSALLTVINLFWNTNIAKSALLSFLEDYIDNICVPSLQTENPLNSTIDRLNQDFSSMMTNLGHTIEQSMTKAFSKIETSANSFEQAANTLEQSRFPEKLSSATNDLAIAQNVFSQSSLVLQKSTQSLTTSLDSMQTLTRKVVEVGQQVNQINQKYSDLLELNKNRNKVEYHGLKEVQTELAKLVDRMEQLNTEV
ncbi:MAG: methyl-accepting chemotaxis protein [Xenococcaceae cyanobacterium MO_207.B15]|nr:methyl-accepting chemotaxis protein [Xenococcaceae cyanobacterium MO_207.B15]